MYKKILVPLDGSHRAEAILPHVEELVQNFDSTVIFLQVIEPIYPYMDVHGYVPKVDVGDVQREALFRRAKDYLAGQKGEFRAKGIQAESIIEEGPVVSTIIRVANLKDVGLIAMASHGRTGLSHVFYGSVAAGVLHIVDRPLLLVRAQGK